MKKKWILWLILLSFFIAGSVLAASVAYNLSWWTVDSGGGRSNGGNYILNSTIGQADTGDMAGGKYILSGGFWPTSSWRLYLPP